MKRVDLEIRDEVAWITMDDGKVNAMSTGLLAEITSALTGVKESARATVLQGRPGIFSAGFDLKVFEQGACAAREMLDAGIRLISTILEHPHPVVALCTGHAYPMGAFLLLAADYRIGAAGQWRIGLNEVAIGITVPRFALALARHRLHPSGHAGVGIGAMHDPHQARLLGYLDEVVEVQDLAARGDAVARQMTALHPVAYRETKRTLHGALLSEISAAGAY